MEYWNFTWESLKLARFDVKKKKDLLYFMIKNIKIKVNKFKKYLKLLKFNVKNFFNYLK